MTEMTRDCLKRKDSMGQWFTVEQIDEASFAVSEYRHWEEPHCYLLCGTERALLIDTGLGVADLGQLVRELTPLPVTAVLTHAHWDHIGALDRFPDFAVHEAERSWLAEGLPLSREAVLAGLMKEPCSFPAGFRAEDYQIFRGEPRRLLRDGDRLDLGGRVLTVLHTPGHSPGHCCFYEPDRRYLFTGDLVYRGCLDAFYPTTDPRQFFRSVRRLLSFEAARLFPGHHDLDIPASLIADVASGFEKLEREGRLRQGAGVFDFGEFSIHL